MKRKEALQMVFAGLALVAVSVTVGEPLAAIFYPYYPWQTAPVASTFLRDFFIDGWSTCLGALLVLGGAYVLVTDPKEPS